MTTPHDSGSTSTPGRDADPAIPQQDHGDDRTADLGRHGEGSATTRLPVTDDADDPGPGDPGDDAPSPAARARRPLLIGAAVVGLLAVLYVGDLLLSSTDVPRGVAVADVAIGGMAKPEARARLAGELAPRVARPVTLQAGDATAALDPAAVGLGVDVDATVERAGDQPLNPWTRLTSLFSTREVEPVTTGTGAGVAAALEGLRPQLDQAPVEGTIVVEGTEPVAVPSREGRSIDAAAGAEEVLANWLDPAPVALPVSTVPVTVTPAGIDAALRDVARPALSAPLYVVGDGANATMDPEEIGSVLRFSPDGRGGLVPAVDPAATRELLEPQLEGTVAEARDATYAITGATPTVVPAVTGRGLDWDRTVGGIVPALARPADASPPPTFTPPPPPADGAAPAEPPPASGRAVNAAYATTPPELTTAELEAAGPPVVIGEFTTRGFATDSGRNIRRIAEVVQGATVAAGETFSLNGYTTPRDTANGYVEAGIIDAGIPGEGVGGGVSQFATTLYNASYFAGLVDITHQEHSYYISRYPAGREATVFEGSIDLRFRNDGSTPVLITTSWTPSTIGVKIWGQKRFDVTSEQGPRVNPTPAGVRDRSGEPECEPSSGNGGFTITDTRTLRDVATGEVRTQPRTVVYNPVPQVTCGGS